MHSTTADPENVALFGSLSSEWWDPEGSSRLLHRLNPVRLAYIRQSVVAHFGLDSRDRRALAGLYALDIGCGAGLVAEPLARMGARTSGLDAGEQVIAAARAHAASQGLKIDYHCADLPVFAESRESSFDLITCLEVFEHVADLPAFLSAIRRLLKPGGLLLFSTPNRTPLSWAVLIAGAEKITRLIPEHGHDWKQFVTPVELTQKMATARLRVTGLRGMNWSPSRSFHLSDDLSINYIGTALPA